MTRYLGGLITKDESLVIPSDNYETTSASGVWTLEEAQMLAKQGLWPTAGNALERAVFGGGSYQVVNTMDYVTIPSTGNATDFGDLTSARVYVGAHSSATRGVIGGGRTTNFAVTGQDFIDYITIASTGNGTDFGNLTVGRNMLGSCNSSTRGIFFGGATDAAAAGTNTIDYITIASTGNATDFGDTSHSTDFQKLAGTSSSTRGVFGGGYEQDGFTAVPKDHIEYITIASTGNGTDFGNLTASRYETAAFSSGTRACFGGGVLSDGNKSNIIDYITISSTGNATDFGDLASNTQAMTGASSSTRGLFAGGNETAEARTTRIQYVTIDSTGNTSDFGDLTTSADTSYGNGRDGAGGMSNVNGGLQ
jgi:hypothetical protein